MSDQNISLLTSNKKRKPLVIYNLLSGAPSGIINTEIKKLNYKLKQYSFWDIHEGGGIKKIKDVGKLLEENPIINPFLNTIKNPDKIIENIEPSCCLVLMRKKSLKVKNTEIDNGIFETPSNVPVFACGDIHGDSYAFKHILLDISKVCFFDKDNIHRNDITTHLDKLHWKKGCNTHIIFCGDMVDRMRPQLNSGRVVDHEDMDLQILKTAIRLDKEARLYGGRLIIVLGNHELMNFKQYYNYVPKQSMNKNRLSHFVRGSSFAKLLSKHAYLAVVVNDFVLVHGGFTIQNTFFPLAESNKRIKESLSTFRNKSNSNINYFWDYISDPYRNGPSWNRDWGFHVNPDCKDIPHIMTKLGLKNPESKKLVIAHCPQHYNPSVSCNINNICNKKVWRIDVAMSRAFDNDLLSISDFIKELLSPNISIEKLYNKMNIIDDFDTRTVNILQLYPETVSKTSGILVRDYYNNSAGKTTNAGLEFLNLTDILHKLLFSSNSAGAGEEKNKIISKLNNWKNDKNSLKIDYIIKLYEKSYNKYIKIKELSANNIIQDGAGMSKIIWI